MNSVTMALRKSLRILSLWILPPTLILVSTGVLVSQFKEIGGNGETLSLTSFVVLLSFSGIGFGWARVGGISDRTAGRVLRSATDLVIASLLALVAVFFSWAGTLQQPAVAPLKLPLFALHWVFLFLSVALSLTALLGLLSASRDIGD